MTEHLNDEELQKTEMWNANEVTRYSPVKRPRTVVSVAFPADAMDLVSKKSEQLGMRTSEFIREAAIEKATGGVRTPLITWQGSSTGSLILAIDVENPTVGTFNMLQDEPSTT